MTTQRDTFAQQFSKWIGDTNDFLKRFTILALAVWDNAIGSVQSTVTVSTTLTAEDSGKTYNIATDAKVFTLPLISADNIGMKFKFRNTGADTAVALTIAPNALDGINGSLSASAGANADATTADGLVSKASGAVDKDLVNTKATANIGDWVELVAVSTTKWFINGGVGIWASQG